MVKSCFLSKLQTGMYVEMYAPTACVFLTRFYLRQVSNKYNLLRL